MASDNQGMTDTPTVPHIQTPENVTKQSMWVWEFNRIKDLITKCDLAKEECFMYKSEYILRYKATLETLSLAFAKFLEEDFKKENKEINILFEKFNEDYYKSKRMLGYGSNKGEGNKVLMDCITYLKRIDSILSIVRQKKGFAMDEQVSFVINDRAKKALSINSNIDKELLKIFNAPEHKRMSEVYKKQEEESFNKNNNKEGE